jgi:predicted DNA-binding transcriptional regulator YafY
MHKLTHRLMYINSLIRQKATGTPTELAEKLGISERSWYKLRDELINDLGLPIAYCSFRRSYYYTEEGTFEIGFRRLSPEKTERISGGFFFTAC